MCNNYVTLANKFEFPQNPYTVKLYCMGTKWNKFLHIIGLIKYFITFMKMSLTINNEDKPNADCAQTW
jgi:hypothetical protein